MKKEKVILATLMLFTALEGRSQAMEEQNQTRSVAIRYIGPGLEPIKNGTTGTISLAISPSSKTHKSYYFELISLNNKTMTSLPDLIYCNSHNEINAPSFIISENEESGFSGGTKHAYSSYLGKKAQDRKSISIPLKNAENHPLEALIFTLRMNLETVERDEIVKQDLTKEHKPRTYYSHSSDVIALYKGDI